jgi:hypothetical protein
VVICRNLTVALQPVNTFLIPDISGDAHTNPAVLKAAKLAAAGLGTGELCLRALAEIGGAWAVCWAINAFLTYVSKKADQVIMSCVEAHLQILPQIFRISKNAPTERSKEVLASFLSNMFPYSYPSCCTHHVAAMSCRWQRRI